MMRFESVVDEVRPFHIAGRVETFDAGQFLGLAHALVGQVTGVFLLLDLVVLVRLVLLQVGQRHRHLVGLGVAANVAERLAGDDERRARLVDEDVVHLVDDGVVERLLALVVVRVELGVAPAGRLHVVAQIVETVLAIGTVGNVAVVGLAAGDGVHVALNEPGRDAECLVNRRHPFAVAAGQVIVDGDDVDAFSLKSVEESGQRGHKRLAFASDHFGDVAAVKDDAAKHLYVEVPHVLSAESGFAAGRERFRQQVVELGPLSQPLAKLRRQRLHLLNGKRVHLLFKRVNLREKRAGRDGRLGAGLVGADVAQLPDVTLVAGADYIGKKAAGAIYKGGNAVRHFLPQIR